ncbi:hypothetical protein KM908_20305 [Alkalihalobacillus clausii]|jgi:hypothetical protein|uniref:hypothetical protein n=1 Tax=Shouchella clausii TaxID=79880 RepID=UPI001C2446C1|nr:hypothetical protein [Shouchella clausii]MBU8598457.1 hypothetical protein [Shouchella clausii]
MFEFEIQPEPLHAPREPLPSILHRCLATVREHEEMGHKGAVIDSTFMRDWDQHKGLVQNYLSKHGYTSNDLDDMIYVFIKREDEENDQPLRKASGN